MRDQGWVWDLLDVMGEVCRQRNSLGCCGVHSSEDPMDDRMMML